MNNPKKSTLFPIDPCQNIDEVIAQLDGIILHCTRVHSKLGFFASLYRDVTVQVRAGIAGGRFEDGPRMERFDVLFANRYFEALDLYWRGKRPTRSWAVAFHSAHLGPEIILQHLLLGMNAHINLDLPIAAVQVSADYSLQGLKGDFFEITVLLKELIDQIQGRIDRVSPWIGLIDRLGGRTDEMVCAFAIAAARQISWGAAERLAALPPEELEREIAAHDGVVAALGNDIRSPGRLLTMGLRVIRLRERHHILHVIEALRLDQS